MSDCNGNFTNQSVSIAHFYGINFCPSLRDSGINSMCDRVQNQFSEMVASRSHYEYDIEVG
ncbi:hypothetical protein NIES2104_39110 [Leptolyngbya sp. NIES-2104]|nr:hypothetical protein NIES2104_39110 [Leptolyngbya sp. NIES-2104]